MKKGKLFVVSGFSGVGKGTVMKSLKNAHDINLSVSATTREPRKDEVHGVNYYYVSKDEFEQMIRDGELLEYTTFMDNYYGSPKKFIELRLNDGDDIVLEIETDGGRQVKKLMPEAQLIFMLPPDADTLKERLVGRGSESNEQIEGRLRTAAEETKYMKDYDYFVINDTVEECMEKIYKIMTGEDVELPSAEEIETIKQDILKFKED